ncbi:hypothetical protein ACFFIY_12145 [Bhargavaea ullalensis]|uniref:Uncharacterized protein n=1 Tax=Bhargavaea ullalensis TaxID=1265685 RepID=A0ABV2G7G2_9BACL
MKKRYAGAAAVILLLIAFMQAVPVKASDLKASDSQIRISNWP